MDTNMFGCNDDELSFMCCLTLADMAQAKGDAMKAKYYIEQAYAAMDRQALTGPMVVSRPAGNVIDLHAA